ncbi:alpha-amylase family protein [Nocardia sp. CDC159]|uniref:Alpha-amylase n=1 Tax=Nocardia pulmonis TaxID=2951408 RepID=A0A9X2E7W5_9NOCA|nr:MULTISPECIES: alpha-amylase family protein [Nocardia]MCM6775205.1 alpha-amylase family protein [Nocardia pulmonis]MCM6789675.1 alpha-amylase family protein [Nocardia sp. CDC159]
MLRSWVLLISTLVAVAGLTAPAAAEPAPERDVIAQMFGWNWRSIGRECRETLGPLGYGAVQTSPPEEHSLLPEQGFPWWQSYSAVSYELNSRYGTRAELAEMVRGCHAAGVRVYVDAVINNMAAIQDCGIGSGATPYCHYWYPRVPYGFDDFHHCGTPNDAIVDYSDRSQVHRCQTFNAADLATDDERVRDRIAGYLNDLLSLGVDGFRIDSAKHIAPEDLSAIEARLSRPAYVYQEVIYGRNDGSRPEDYLGTGDVMDLRYAGALSAIFRRGHLAQLREFGSALPSDSSVVFVANHDTVRHGVTLTYADPERYTLANAFLLTWPYGHPKILSDYAFTNYDEPSPSDPLGRTLDATCGDGHWLCEHTWPGIAGMVGFHQQTRGEPVVDWFDNSGDLIAFGRGGAGFVVLNGESSAMSGASFRTSLPQGTYCDVMHGAVRAGVCTGPAYDIDETGRLRADLAPLSGLALHIGAVVTR